MEEYGISISNPVTQWWMFLVGVSFVNICFWFWMKSKVGLSANRAQKWLILLSGMYVFGCAFRSILPRADVQRHVLVDTWFSSVFVGRSVATVAELCFAAQWAIVLYFLGKQANGKTAHRLAFFVFPLIFAAELFSWYAVITTNYIGNTIEESIWAITYALIVIGLISVRKQFQKALRHVIDFAIVGSLGYVIYMVTVDVPMYFNRFGLDQIAGKQYLGISEGLLDLNTRWIVTHDPSVWYSEMGWMGLYFSLAVMASIALCFLPLNKNSIQKFLVESKS